MRNLLLLQICCSSLLILFVKGDLVSFCPGQSRPLTCSNPLDVIIFQSAFWGRSDQCGVISAQDICVSNSTLSALTNNCFRKRSCYIDYLQLYSNYRSQCSSSNTELVLNYLCVPAETVENCRNGILNVTSQNFVYSRGFPDGYPAGYRCMLQLTGGHGKMMKVTLLYLKLRYSSERRNCDDPLVFKKGTDSVYTVCDPKQVQDDYTSLQRQDEMFTWEYSLRESYQVEVSFEASQFDDLPNRGFLFKVEVFGCSNDELEQFTTNATIALFEASRQVRYGCTENYELVGSGVVQCVGTKWMGDPGMCYPKGVDLIIPTTTTSTTNSTTTSTTTTTSMPPTTTTTTTLPTTTTRSTSTTPTTTTITTKPVLPTATTRSTSATVASTTTTAAFTATTVSTTTTKLTTSSDSTTASTASTTTTTPATTASTSLASTSTTKSTTTNSSNSSATFTPSRSFTLTTTTASTSSRATKPYVSDVGQNIIPNTPVPSTPRKSSDLPTVTTEGTTIASIVNASTGSGSVWTVTAIGLSVGILGLILLFLLIMFLVTKARRNKHNQASRHHPITTLRPSAHACVSIPNTYGGGIGGFTMPRNSTKPYPNHVHLGGMEEDTIGKIKKKNRVKLNNNTTILGSDDEVRTSKISDISYNSSLYELSNGKGFNGSANSTTFLLEDAGAINPDYYVERTGYESGTTGFIGNSGDFPEVHFVEIGSHSGLDLDLDQDSARHSGLEPIAEESQLHHSDIIADPDSVEHMDNVMNMNSVLAELQSRNSGGSGTSGGLATIPEEGRDPAAEEEDSISSSTFQRPSTVIRTPYSRTSLEGTRIPRGTLKQIEKSKVDYALFKDDETGNLENYLDDRRGSC